MMWADALYRWLVRADLRRHQEKVLLLLSLVVSATVGLVVVAFLVLTDRMSKLLLASGGAPRLLSPIAGSLVAGWLLYRYFPEARGSGIPQTRVALILNSGVIRFRTVVGKFVCCSLSLASGLALGREGPSVHIGAGIASSAARRLGLSPEQVRTLIPVGTAAAIAAAFNTPLAAVLFTLEEILADLHARVVGAVVLGAATSWTVLHLLLGDEPLFHVPAYQLVHPVEFLVYALLGLAGGVVSTVFVRLLLWQRRRFLRIPRKWKAVTPAAGGLFVGVIALMVPGVLGVGYPLVGDALNGRLAVGVMLLLLALKIVATATCYSSGNAGGIFGPALFIGAMLGGTLGQVAHGLLPDHTGNAGAYALVGMGAAFAGIIRTPMTSVIMIFEVTRDYSIIVPLMIANSCSYALACRLQKTPIYEALLKQEGIQMPSPAHVPDPLTVEQAMQPLGDSPPAVADVAPPIYPDDPLDAALQRMGESGAESALVLNRVAGAPVGTLSYAGALQAYRQPAVQPDHAQTHNGLPVAAVVVVAALMLVGGLAFWQRARGAEIARASLRSGEALLARGDLDEAIAALRESLAHAPSNATARAALGIALTDSHQFDEAAVYLMAAAQADPRSGPVQWGLAQVSLAGGDRAAALRRLERSLALDWPEPQQWRRDNARLQLADLLERAGRRAEAASELLAVISSHPTDSGPGLRAAAALRAFASPAQLEEAYADLAVRFPADASVWMELGDARFAAGHETTALDAYRNAAGLSPGNQAAMRAIARTGQILDLDPAGRGLSVRERARRWTALLQRTIDSTTGCGSSSAIDQARLLLRQRTITIELSDRMMEATLAIWRSAPTSCRSDPVLAHILGQRRE